MTFTQLRSFASSASNVLLMLSASPDLRAALPRIFSGLDRLIPVLLAAKAPASIVEQEISGLIALSLRRPALATDLALVMRLYSPILNAARQQRGAK